MSLPPGFVDEVRTRTSLAQVVGRKVMWDARKSNPGKGDMWAPCPFHVEKSASFHVDDRKGFYYCFGCHAKGDAVSFIRNTENVGFMEAIEILAREAGLPVPERDPLAQARTDHRTRLAEVMETAVRFYRLQLNTGAGAGARAYVARRKLSADSQARFEIGFAPDSRTALWSHLTGQGVAAEMIQEAGLSAVPEDGGTPYDRFRDRIIFPIRDARGRCIGLGGRAMAADARSKYLNSPETELFDKGRSLYNHGPAREAAGKGQPLIVAEGYMDTIALVEAGFGATVAPLGTAITEDQLRLMWRIHPEPIIALDGDTAGLRAAMRLVDLALPLIEAGQSLRFCILPEGKDPDDVIRTDGPAAMQRLLDQAQPMVSLLWRRETEGKTFDSPERRASLDKTLRAVLATIRDAGLRAHYEDAVKQLRYDLFMGQRTARPREAWPRREPWTPGSRKPPPPTAMAATKSSLLGAATGSEAPELLNEALILAILVTHPSLVRPFEAALENLHLTGPDHEALRTALLRHADAPDRTAFRDRIAADAGSALEKLFELNHVRIAPPVRNADDAGFAKMCLAEDLARLEARRGAQKETLDAIEDLAGQADEGLTWRLGQAAGARDLAARSKLDEVNNLGEDRAALSRQLQALIDGEVWVKKSR